MTAEGEYLLSVGPGLLSESGHGMDQSGDGQPGQPDDVFQTTVQIKTTPPPAPQVAQWQVDGQVNITSQTAVTLQGTAEAHSTVFLGEVAVSTSPSGSWQTELPLTEGMNSFSLTAVDQAGNVSPATVLAFLRDTTAPQIIGVQPDGFINIAPDYIEVLAIEDGAGLSLSQSWVRLMRDGVQLQGQLAVSDAGVVFVPGISLPQGEYSISVMLQDLAGNQSAVQSAAFTLDTTPPPPPVIDPVPVSVTDEALQLTGTREAYAAIVMGAGAETVVGHGESEQWSYTVHLEPGPNELVFRAMDRAGNLSEPVTVTVRYDNEPPAPVAVSVEPEGRGTDVGLSWAGYDEAGQSSTVVQYRIYRAAAGFTDIAQAEYVTSLPAGAREYRLTGLPRNLPVFVAVVAVDTHGFLDSQVQSVGATPVDIRPPERPGVLQVESRHDALLVSWAPSADTDGDLKHYRVYLGGELHAETSETSLLIDGLAAATRHDVAVTAVDHDGNASPSRTNPGVTLLANPVLTEGVPGMSRAILQWQPTEPGDLVARQRIYVADAAFTDIAEATPVLTVAANRVQATVTGLQNDRTYYLAVAAENLSGGINPVVNSIAVTPEEDTDGPEITSAFFDAEALQPGLVITRRGTLRFTAQDESGVASIAAWFGETALGTARSGPEYRISVSTPNFEDGEQLLRVSATDTLGNVSEHTWPVSILLDPAEPAMITAPSNGLMTADEQIALRLAGEAGTVVTVQVNGADQITAQPLDSRGEYRGEILLQEGENQISVRSRYANRTQFGEPSEVVVVTLDSVVPDRPSGLTARSRPGRQVDLAWIGQTDSIAGFNVYRAMTADMPLQAATKVNAQPITRNELADIPPFDDTYFYRVTAVGITGLESAPTSPVQAVADGTPPTLEAVTYTPQGAHDPETQRIGVGRLDVSLLFSEPLRAVPYTALLIEGLVPIPVTLQRDAQNDRRYHGHITVHPHTPSGRVTVSSTAVDVIGNRAALTYSDNAPWIDTDGPALDTLQVMPGSPIDNNPSDSGGLNRVLVTAAADAELVGEPVLVPHIDDVPVSGYASGLSLLSEIDPHTGRRHWSGTFDLPAEAGLDSAGDPAVQRLSFTWQAEDALGNSSERITAHNAFQVYQGDLPPFEAPRDLVGHARAGGEIALSWTLDGENHGVRVFRRGPGESAAVAVLDLPADTAAWRDTGAHGFAAADRDGLQEGTYIYAVATLRQVGDDEAESGRSNEVSVDADATPPQAPEGLDATVQDTGVELTWTHAEPASVATYRVYRLATPLQGEALPDEDALVATPADTTWQDPQPSELTRYYQVAAEDAAGNISPLSEPVHVSDAVLPLADVEAHRDGDRLTLHWRHDSEAVHSYHVLTGASDRPLTPPGGLVAGQGQYTVTDEDYQPDPQGRRYRIEARTQDGEVLRAREWQVPDLRITLGEMSGPLGDRIHNRVPLRVSHRGPAPVTAVTAWLHDATEATDRVSTLVPGDTAELALPLAAAEGLTPGTTTVQAMITATLADGTRLHMPFAADVPVEARRYQADVEVAGLQKVSQGTLRLVLRNPGALPVEVETARHNGSRPSQTAFIELRDVDDDSLLMRQPVHLATGNVVTRTDGVTVARVYPGEEFVSSALEISTAAITQDDVRVVLDITATEHRHQGLVSVMAPGMRASRQVSTRDLPYQPRIDTLTPTALTWVEGEDNEVLIQGDAWSENSGAALADVPVQLVLDNNGFERVRTVTTDAQGRFSYRFRPTLQDAGVYTVSAIYPGSALRSSEHTFTVGGIAVQPTRLQGNLPRDYRQAIPVELRNVGTETVEGLHWQIGSGIPDGVSLELGEPITLAPGERHRWTLYATASDSPGAQGQIPLVLRDHTGQRLSSINLSYQIVASAPALRAGRPYLQLGTRAGEYTSEQMLVTNMGHGALANPRVSLVNTSGSGSAPAWISAVAHLPAALEAGSSLGITVSANPGELVGEGEYEYRLRITGDNLAPFDIPVYVVVTNADTGGFIFHASDIYTATLDEYGNPIPGLEGARISLQNVNVLSETYQATTDSFGLAEFDDLPVGQYYYRASAPNREARSGHIWVRPGVTGNQDVFLLNQLVTIEWSVEEITLQDQYDIVLRAVFETNVPAAVVVMEPASVQLPPMREGDVFQGELRLTNYGLIRAENVQADLNLSNEWYRLEFMTTPPAELEAGQVVVMPYRVTALQDVGQTSNEIASVLLEDRSLAASRQMALYGLMSQQVSTSGSNCRNPTPLRPRVTCEYECANGERVSTSASSSISGRQRNSCSGGSIGGGAGGGWGGGSGGGGVGSRPAPSAPPNPGGCGCDGCGPPDGC
ncbi:fibronectin type III domain-containing protein [Isoalcanivorax indicus]|uniref:fibronectin type III domain-containing protein n=1 Tax=Isoalcanivorax indicus TaxID=2202653 RepID=UPI001FE6A656|nr:hypothetical protein [Isoalcanivorax indicus]